MATILCIDDSRHMLELHQALLESRGYKVLIAPDGATGIALSRQQSVDVVVLDFNMPGMDGKRVAQVMMQEQPTLPVVQRAYLSLCGGSPTQCYTKVMVLRLCSQSSRAWLGRAP